MVLKGNELDRIKEEKYSPMNERERVIQEDFFKKWTEDMLHRKTQGDEKYGNYMLEVDDKTSFEELREEMLDCCNHLIMLTYKLRKVFVKDSFDLKREVSLLVKEWSKGGTEEWFLRRMDKIINKQIDVGGKDE